jgi:hypothetical protein
LSELQRDRETDAKGKAGKRNAVGGATTRAVVLGDYHFLEFEDGSEEIYNYRTDPDELTNLVDSLAGDPLLAQIRAALDSLLAGHARPRSRSAAM